MSVSAGTDEGGHPRQCGGEVHVVDRGVARHQIEGGIGQLRGEEVGRQHGDIGQVAGGLLGSFAPRIDPHDLAAASGEQPQQQPVAATDVECTVAGRRGQGQRVIVRVVVPPARQFARYG
jgi:hypothetical protein